MGSLENMRCLLRPTGLYRLDGKSLVDRELAVYAAAIDAAEERAAKAVSGAFVFWADGEQLDRLLELIGACEFAEGKNDDGKRELITALLSVRATSFTNQDFIRVVKALGGDVTSLQSDIYLREIILTLPEEQKELFLSGSKRYELLCRLLPPDYALITV